MFDNGTDNGNIRQLLEAERELIVRIYDIMPGTVTRISQESSVTSALVLRLS